MMGFIPQKCLYLIKSKKKHTLNFSFMSEMDDFKNRKEHYQQPNQGEHNTTGNRHYQSIENLVLDDVFFNALPLGLVVFQIIDIIDITKNKIIAVNSFFMEITGHSPEKLIGKNITQLIKTENLQSNFYKELLEKNIPYVIKSTLINEEKHFHITIFKQSDQHIVAAFNDYTRLKEAQDTITFEKNLFQTLLNKFPDAIYFKDREARFLRASLHLTHVFKTTPNEIIGKTDFDFYPKALAEKKFADDMSVINTGMPIINKIERGNIQGDQVRWLSTTKLPLFNRKGEIEGMFGISRNITDKKLAEEKEQEYKKNLINLTESSLNLLRLKTQNEIYTFLCSNLEKQIKHSLVLYCHITGNNFDLTTSTESLEHAFFIKHLNKNKLVESLIQDNKFREQCFKGKIVPCNKEFQDCYVDNDTYDKFNELDIKNKYIISINEDRSILGIFLILIKSGHILADKSFVETFIQQSSLIIHRKKLEEQLIIEKERAEESDNLKNSFLANLSHEIRTPINAIQGFGELLKVDDLPFQKKTEYIEIIQEKSGQLIQIIADIIDISKFESNQVKVTPSEGNLNDFLLGIVSDYQHRISKYIKKDITLSLYTGLPNNNCQVKTDFELLKKVLVNLLTNAIKFTQYGVIELGYEPRHGKLHFYVLDSGIGIPEDKRDIIFLRFRQVDESRTRKYGGTGLGLTISKSILDLLEGTIWAEDALKVDFREQGPFKQYPDLQDREKLGAKLIFTIPQDKVQTKEIQEEAKGKLSNWNNKQILVVEDDSFNYHYIYEVLDIKEPVIHHCKNGKEAVEFYEQNKNSIDIILMDLQMPVMDGYEATRLIREKDNKVPIIVQTAYSMPEDSNKAREVGATDFIVKPYSSNALIDIIAKHIS
jgi:PAS domain S-box-containing protein